MVIQTELKSTHSKDAHNLYESPSTKGYQHSIQSYFAEILLIKKFPNLIKDKYCWRLSEHSAQYHYFLSLAHDLTSKYPVHLLVEIVVHSNITDFNADGIIGYINKKVLDWSAAQNTVLKKWCEASEIKNIEPRMVSAKKTFGKLRW